MQKKYFIEITPDRASVGGKELPAEGRGHELLVSLYRRFVGDYPKFFKMDALSRLGFIASELLLQAERDDVSPADMAMKEEGREDRALVFFNRSSSLCDDMHYQDTIAGKDNFFPSPKVFVYTLPNIVTGEIAIRNKYYGETCFYVIDSCDEALIDTVARQAFDDDATTSVITGWLDCISDDEFEARVWLIEKENNKQ